MSSLDLARADLRVSLGRGARHDSLDAPIEGLRLARLATAYFARKLNEISDAGLSAASAVAGWSRGHVVAYIGLHAREMALQFEALRLGHSEVHSSPEQHLPSPLQSPVQWAEATSFTQTLPPHALRYLFHHAAVHLNVEWRDLAEGKWASSLPRRHAPADTQPLERTAVLWLGALALQNGARLSDVPLVLRSQPLPLPAGAPPQWSALFLN